MQCCWFSFCFCSFVFFTSVRLISRKRQNLSTVLPPPPISPLNMVKDVAYNRKFNMMYLLMDEQEIWVYYTRYSLSNVPKGVSSGLGCYYHNCHPKPIPAGTPAFSSILISGNFFLRNLGSVCLHVVSSEPILFCFSLPERIQPHEWSPGS